MQSKQLGSFVSTHGSTWMLMALAGGVCFAMPTDVTAQDATWKGPGNEWTTSSNWTPATPTNNATFINNGAPTSVTISSNASIATLDFDAAAPAYTFTVRNAATFNITSGTTSGSSLLPAFRVDAGATLRIDDQAFVEIDTLADGASGGGAVVVGPPGSTFALLSIHGDTNSTFSGTISGTGSLELNGSGITTLTGASNGGNIGTLAGDLMLCNCGPGGLTISSGSLTVEGFMGVAVEGGTLSVVNGGSLQVANGDLLVASNMAVSGSGSNVTVAGFTGVGIFGPATLTIGDGGTLTSQSGAEIDALFGGTPTATVSGPASTWNIGGSGLAVGGGSTGGPGALTVDNGGTVNVSGPMVIGDTLDGSSLALVTGAGSVVTVAGPLVIGDPCDCLVGTLTVADGGVVNATLGTSIGLGSTLNLGTGGVSGAIVTPTIDNGGAIVANFTDMLTVAADISGAGTLSKAGSGILTLTGNNSYTGGTTVTGGLINFSTAANLGTGTVTLNGGGLQWAAGNTSDISAQLAAIGSGGATFDTNGNNVSLASNIGGPGRLTKQGSGTLILSGTNSYAGSTTVTGGLINFATANNFGTGTITLDGGGLQWATGNTTDISSRLTALGAGGGTFDTNGNNVMLLGDGISGPGGLTKVGAGTLTLGPASTYSGGTTVLGGVLQGTTSSLQGNIFNNANVTFNQFGNGTYAGNMSGSGGVTVRGGGAVTFSGTNSYSGGTTVMDATLAGTTSSLQGAIVNNASVMFNQAGNGTYAGNMSGSGGVTVQGGGTVTFSGTNSYSGGTTVSAGTLAGTTSSLQGNINNNAAVTFDQGTNGTYAGAMSGSGSLTKAGNGTVTLTGANTYSGGTTISGGILQVGNGGTTGSIAGNVVNNSVLAFNRSDTITFGGTLSGSGALDKLGAGTLILTADNTYSGVTTIAAGTLQLGNGGTTGSIAGNVLNNGFLAFNRSDNVTFAGNIDGSGAIAYMGPGTVTLTGTIANTGGTVLAGGTVEVGSDSALGAAGATLTFAGGTLQATASFTLGRPVNLITGGGTIDTAGNTLTVSGNVVGAGGLTKTGTGTLILNGTSSYTGGTTVSGGVLQGNSASLQGNIVNNAAVVFDQSGSGTYGGVMSGTGGLTKVGPGTLILSGTNTYSGGTTVSGGILQGNTASLQGNILNSSSVVFDQAGLGTYGGNMSGIGMLTKTGNGQLILTGANSYSGGTLVSGGILQGTTTSLQGNILNNATVAFNQAGTGTYTGNMSGSGGLLINGTGTVILAGANSYTGGTTVSGGILQGNSLSLQGNILDNASVVFNQTATGTYAGVMSGTGGMTLQGGGVLTMTGFNTYSGATTVNAGTLVVNGSLAGSVALNSGGILGGSGSIGPLAINGGTIAPGNSIGTLTVNGTFSQNGGAYVVEANAQGQSDRLNVNGGATINGATVQVAGAPGSYANSTIYAILNATSGVTGTYSGVSSNFAFLTPSLSYDANNVFLTLALQGAAFSGFSGNTVNQRAVGYALDQTFANASGDFATVIGVLAGLSTTQGPAALDAISGQQYADFGTTNVANASLFMNTLGQQMALARNGSAPASRVALAQACDAEACDAARPLSAWFSGLGGLGSVQGDGNSSTLTYNVGGAAAGIDYRFDPRFLVGVGVGYAHGTQWVNSFMGQGWSDSVSVAAYGSFTQAGFYADALAGYAYISNQMQRQIQIPGLQPRSANGSTGANQFLAQVETGYKVGVWDMAALTPFARFQTSSTTQNAFTETGANSLNLNVAQQTTTSVRTVLGAEFASTIPLGSERTLGLSLRLGWQHEYANTARPITASFAGAPSPSFTVYGATPTRDAAIVGFSASTTVAAATQLYLRYDGELASGTDNHALTAGLRMSW